MQDRGQVQVTFESMPASLVAWYRWRMTVTIGRRELLATLGGAALAWPLAARAQQPAVPVIGFLTTASPSSRGGEQLAAFHSGLREAGYTEGQNVRVEYRWASDDYSRLPVLAAELVGLQVAVLVTAGGQVSALVAHDATKAVPLILQTVAVPVMA